MLSFFFVIYYSISIYFQTNEKLRQIFKLKYFKEKKIEQEMVNFLFCFKREQKAINKQALKENSEKAKTMNVSQVLLFRVFVVCRLNIFEEQLNFFYCYFLSSFFYNDLFPSLSHSPKNAFHLIRTKEISQLTKKHTQIRNISQSFFYLVEVKSIGTSQ